MGTTGPNRFFGLPEVPTISESGFPDYVATSWQGLAGPAGLPQSIVERLNAEITGILGERAVVERLRALGNDPRSSSPAEFQARVIADVSKWSDVVAAANIERI